MNKTVAVARDDLVLLQCTRQQAEVLQSLLGEVHLKECTDAVWDALARVGIKGALPVRAYGGDNSRLDFYVLKVETD